MKKCENFSIKKGVPYRIKKKFHDLFSCGFPFSLYEVDDESKETHYVFTCCYCDFLVQKDSQGNWFHLSRKIIE